MLLNIFLFLLFQVVIGQYNCTKAGTAFCESPSYGLSGNIIFRCEAAVGSAVPGNCNDDLADVPPVGLKYAFCWESSPTSGDAQCTFNCVSVTAANGTTFYPVGCDRSLFSTSSAISGATTQTTSQSRVTTSTGLSSFGSSPTSATSTRVSSSSTSIPSSSSNTATLNAAMRTFDHAKAQFAISMLGWLLWIEDW